MPRGLNPYDEARIQGRLWHPRLLGGNFYAGFSANERSSVVITSGSSVNTWRDFSGNGRDVSTAGTKPTFVENSLNSRPALLFSTSPLSSTATLPAGSTYSWLFLGKDNNATATISEPFSVGTSLSVNSMELVLDYDGGVTSGVFSGFNGVVLGKASGSPIKSTPTLISLGLDSGVGRARINGVNGTNGGSGITTNQSLFALGWSRPQGQYPFNGNIYCFLAVGSAMGSPDFLKAEAWIAWEYGVNYLLPASHPFRNRPPLIGD